MLYKHPQSLRAFSHSAETEKMESSSLSVKHELGIGNQNLVRVKQEKPESLFTAQQLQELYLPIYPSSTGSTARDSDNEIMTDPEQERCKRTDGRKWRCKKNVLPNEKYCERHMHRGRKRSRKLVECSRILSQPNNQTLASNNIVMPKSSPNVKLKKSIKEDEDEPRRCKRTEDDPRRCKMPKSAPNVEPKKSIAEDEDEPRRCKMPKSAPNVEPKSAPKVELKKSITEDKDDPCRCKRTDGRRWRCGKEVIPGRKYCETHMHRGSKRAVLDSKLGTNSSTMPTIAHSSINLKVKPASREESTESRKESTESKSTRSSDVMVSDENGSTCDTLVRPP